MKPMPFFFLSGKDFKLNLDSAHMNRFIQLFFIQTIKESKQQKKPKGNNKIQVPEKQTKTYGKKIRVSEIKYKARQTYKMTY